MGNTILCPAIWRILVKLLLVQRPHMKASNTSVVVELLIELVISSKNKLEFNGGEILWTLNPKCR